MLKHLLFLVFGLLLTGLALAQLTDHPSTVPVPLASFNDPARAVVLELQFNSMTSVSPVAVSVARTRARGSVGNPSQLLLELLDPAGQVISAQYAYHPLWVRDIDDQGVETGLILASGPATFYVPLSEMLRSVRITDLALDVELINVDVSHPVTDYCSNSAPTPICALFMDGFE